MCGGSRADATSWRAVHPHFPFSTASLIQGCLVPHLRDPVTTSDPRVGVITGRNANSLTISVQHLEREPNCTHLSRIHHPHPLLLRPGLARGGAIGPHRKMFATSIGIPVSATVGLTAHSDTRRTLPRNLVAPTSPMEWAMRKALRIRLWTFSRWKT